MSVLKSHENKKNNSKINSEFERILSSPEELIADISAGKIVVLVDDEDRENEGDLLISGE